MLKNVSGYIIFWKGFVGRIFFTFPILFLIKADLSWILVKLKVKLVVIIFNVFNRKKRPKSTMKGTYNIMVILVAPFIYIFRHKLSKIKMGDCLSYTGKKYLGLVELRVSRVTKNKHIFGGLKYLHIQFQPYVIHPTNIRECKLKIYFFLGSRGITLSKIIEP
jgi:hypothetical protein